MKKLIEKIYSGDSISDSELKELIKFLRDTESCLRQMPASFSLAWKESFRLLDKCEDFYFARFGNRMK